MFTYLCPLVSKFPERYPVEDTEVSDQETRPPLPHPHQKFALPTEAVADFLMIWIFLLTFAKPSPSHP